MTSDRQKVMFDSEGDELGAFFGTSETRALYAMTERRGAWVRPRDLVRDWGESNQSTVNTTLMRLTKKGLLETRTRPSGGRPIREYMIDKDTSELVMRMLLRLFDAIWTKFPHEMAAYVHMKTNKKKVPS